MAEENEVEIEIEDDENPSDEDILLYSTFAGPRIFVLNNVHMTNVLGILLEESDDSFLVGLPARVMEQPDKSMKVEAFAPVPYIRMMKSAIISVMYTFGVFDTMYMKYVEVEGRKIYPEVDNYIEDGQFVETELVNLQEPIDSAELDISLNKDAPPGTVAQGMADDELRDYLLEKFNTGGLSSGSRKKQ